jgi:hypothetical protein
MAQKMTPEDEPTPSGKGRAWMVDGSLIAEVNGAPAQIRRASRHARR